MIVNVFATHTGDSGARSKNTDRKKPEGIDRSRGTGKTLAYASQGAHLPERQVRSHWGITGHGPSNGWLRDLRSAEKKITMVIAGEKMRVGERKHSGGTRKKKRGMMIAALEGLGTI